MSGEFMNNQYKINIYSEVNGNAAVSVSDGDAIYAKICAAIINSKTVVLDFLNIDFITSAFLNMAVGQLYNNSELSEQQINDIKLENISNADRKLYEQVMERAQKYYNDPEYRKQIIESLKREIANDNDN